MPVRTLIGLLLCNLIWALNPAAGKVLLRSFDPLQVAWLRYASCLVAYLSAAKVLRHLPRREPWPRIRFDHALMPIGRGRQRIADLRLLFFGGILTFCLSPISQVAGLNASRATDNAMITALEPLITLVMARLFLRERLPAGLALGFCFALTGFALLSGVNPFDAAGSIGESAHIIGNLLILASLIGEGGYSIFGRKLMVRHPANEIFGSAVGIGVIALTLVVLVAQGSGSIGQLIRPESWSAEALLALIWIGPVGTAFTYLFWMIALRTLSVGSLALTLFIQPLAGAAFGSLFFGEYLTRLQWFGGALILGSVLSQVWGQRNRS